MPDAGPAAASTPLPAEVVEPYLEPLNAQQRLAVRHGVTPDGGRAAGPLLVIAGAGTGKTNTLACRVAHLVRHGADPQRLLLLTFSRRAAADMERRAGRFLAQALALCGGPPPALPWAGTFHAVGARLLREYAPRIGLSEQFTILDRGDAEDLLALVRHDLGLSATQRRFPSKSTCLAIYSRVVNAGDPLGDVLARVFPWCEPWELELRKLFDAYVEAKQAQHVLDYDDLLLWWAQMVAEPALAREIGGRFDHVLVDEYQDTNRLQATILEAMKPDGRGVTVVGDDAQAIYGFRAATVRNILDFPTRYEPAACIVKLERNYRSTSAILAASNAVIALATERHAKDLWTEHRSAARPRLVSVRDEADQARYVAERVLERRESGTLLRAQAVLFRTASHSTLLELELARRDIPFVKYGGLRFLEAAHVKDALAVLRWADNPRHRIAGFRALRLVPGIGRATATRVLDATASAADVPAALAAVRIPASAAVEWDAFRALVGTLRSAPAWPADVELVTRWVEPQLPRLYDDPAPREADLAQLRAIASTYPARERFLSEMALDPPDATSDEAGPPGRDDDYLILSTIHSAKGREWTSVHVLNVVDGCIPSDMATGLPDEIEEERRLLYVAMTRAKDELHLVVPQKFFVHQQGSHGDRHVYASRTRFIPNRLLPLFEGTSWPPAPAPDARAGPAPAPPIDLAARLRAMWK
jgi:DNA helicase-2/ATP-dependent DNA helicase PcrA